MKPVSLADISYSQALQILGMRKEALDSGEIQRLPRHLLEDSYYFRDAGESLQEKQSFDWKKLPGQIWKNPTGKATLLGAGLGGLAGLGKTVADDEDDSYFGNIATGMLGGGALGLGGGLAFDSKTRNSLVNKFREATNRNDKTPESNPTQSSLAEVAMKRRVEEAMRSNNSEQRYVDAEAAANSAGWNHTLNRAGQAAITVAPAAVGASKLKPTHGNIDVAEAANRSPQSMDYAELGRQKLNSPTLEAGMHRPRSYFPPAGNLYGIPDAPKTPTPVPPKPQSAIPSLDEQIPGTNKFVMRSNTPLNQLVDAMNAATPEPPKLVPPKPTTPPKSPQSRQPAKIVGQVPVEPDPAAGNIRKQVATLMEVSDDKVSQEAVDAFRAWSTATPRQQAAIVTELGLDPQFLTGRVQDPALLNALSRQGQNIDKGKRLVDPSRVGVGTSIGDAIETRSTAPLRKMVTRIPKGKLAILSGLLGLGYTGSGLLGQNARASASKVKSRDAEMFRKKLQEAISRQYAGGN